MTEPFVPKGRLLLVSIAQEIKNRKNVYDATRFAWRVNRKRVESVDLILGCINGVVEDVFVASEWLDATETNFPGIPAIRREGRFGFVGKSADRETRLRYVGKRVPDSLRIGQNPLRYFDEPSTL